MAVRSPQSNIEIIFTDWLDALRCGDTERMAARLSPNAIHQGVKPDWICSNREEILEQVSRRRNILPSVDALELVAAGDNVVMSVRAPSVGASLDQDGVPRGQACIVFTIQDDKIVQIQDYVNRDDALEAAGAAVAWQ